MTKLVPGRAYRNSDEGEQCRNFNGKWMVACTETHFLVSDEGWCAYFRTEGEAEAAYAKHLKREPFETISYDELLLNPISEKDRAEIARLNLLFQAGVPPHQIVL